MKIRVKTNPGGGDPTTPQPLTPQQMREWNMFIDFLQKKGIAGSKDLDSKNKNLGANLFEQFRKEVPGVTITYDIVKPVQTEMQKLKDAAQSFAARRGDLNASNIMSGVSKVDGWLGSRTSQFKFPEMTENQLHNNQLVASNNLGLLGGGLKPAGATAMLKKPTIPTNAKIEKLQDGYYYQDESTGDLVKVRDL